MVGLERLLWPLRRRVLLMVGRAVLRAVRDDFKRQTVQVEALRGEVLEGAEHMQPYGFTAHPHPGAEALVLSLGGMRQHPVVVVVDDPRHRVRDLEEGEVCVYTDEDEEDNPHRILLKRGRGIELKCGDSTIAMSPERIDIDSPLLHLNENR